jgi:hypothetical protein
MANPAISEQSVFCSIFFCSSQEILKQFKLKSSDNQFVGQSDSNFEILQNTHGHTVLIGIDSLSGHYVISENLQTKEVTLSGYVDFPMNTLVCDALRKRVLVAGASKHVCSVFLDDMESVSRVHRSNYFKEIFDIKLVKNNTFLILSGDSNFLEVLDSEKLKLRRVVSTKTDIFMFRFINRKLYFYDDESYTTISFKI